MTFPNCFSCKYLLKVQEDFFLPNHRCVYYCGYFNFHRLPLSVIDIEYEQRHEVEIKQEADVCPCFETGEFKQICAQCAVRKQEVLKEVEAIEAARKRTIETKLETI